MDKESIIELQKIDCNCNDCKFMNRDFEKHKASSELHKEWQWNQFNEAKNRLIERADFWDRIGEHDKSKEILIEVKNMRFVFDKSEVSINYGHCQKFDMPVSFIPNTCQLETQNCFEHRRS